MDFMPGSVMLRRVAFAGIAICLNAFAQGSLTANPQQVQLAAPAGSTTPAVQTVELFSRQPVQTNASVQYLNPVGGWLSVAPATGTAPGTLTLSASAAALTEGTYNALVGVTSGGLATFVTVTFTVVGTASTGRFVLDQTGLIFVGQTGVAAVMTQTLSVSAPRGATGPVAFTLRTSSSGNWLSATASSSVTPATLTVMAVQTPAMSGALTGSIAIVPTAGGNPTVVPVTLLAGPPRVAGILTLSQTTVATTYQVGTAGVPVQSVIVSSSAGVETYTASTATSWIRLATIYSPTPTTAVMNQTPGEFNIVFNPAGLPPGNHLGVITVVTPNSAPEQLPVSLTVTNSSALNANPSSLTLDADNGYAAAISITSTSSAHAFNVAVSASSPWLMVTPATGTTVFGLEVLSVSANLAGLAAGAHSGTITLTEQGGGGATLVIPVRAIVASGATANTLVFSKTAVEMTTVAGGANPSDRIDLSSSTPGAGHAFTAVASSTGGWLTVEPFSGSAPAPLVITANLAALPGAGVYEGFITVTSLMDGTQTRIGVKLTVSEQALSANPASLSFEHQATAPPSARQVEITAVPATSFALTALPRWITVTPDRGTTPATLTVSVDPAGFAPGTHSANIEITTPRGRLTIPVSLKIPAPPPPAGPAVAPETIAFSHELGRPAPAAQTISVTSTGDTPVRFTASARTSSGNNWLVITPTSGSTPATVTATVDLAQVTPGAHTATVTIAPSDASSPARSVSVRLNVSQSSVAVQALLNAATQAPTAIAPGMIVILTGAGLGPAAGVTAEPTPAGAYESKLADIRVLFEGIPSPLLYVRNNQINAVVPYALHGRSSARVQVEAGASFSLPLEARVVDAAPGLFTRGANGRGQAAALNADDSVNSAANPAARGSIVSVFGTGEGQTDPQGQDGRVILTDLRRPRLPVTARIGGQPAEVLYAGSAPSQISGVFQANVRIPEGIDPGAVPIEIRVGDAATQAGVTINVR